MNTEILDVRNMLCPMPVIRTQATVARLKHGDRLVALCTDPGALNDIPAWVRIHGHRLMQTLTSAHQYRANSHQSSASTPYGYQDCAYKLLK
jgi:tRNA 2-thiouridine synthesizing protein A